MLRKTSFTIAVSLALSVLPASIRANPSGGNVAAGSASIAGQGTSAVKVTQASNTAIINWQTFSINSGESTSFLQPSASSAALNRVLGGQTSVIDGSLTANGQIYLINGNGVVVGPGGVITANAFTASTRDISNADFLSGNLHFTGTSSAGVQNLGTITALGGDVVLIGRTVDNEGTINAAKGTAGLIAGDDVLLAQKNADGSTITVSPDALATRAAGKIGVNNSGTINAAAAELKAANGNIYALAIQNSGVIRATTVKKQGGRIWLTSDAGTVSNSGTLDASATAANGKGGTVTLKSAKGTVSHTGKLLAQGGPGGAGGSAEISGANLQLTGTVDLTAPGGTTGSLLLDPDTLDIVSTGGTGTIGSLPVSGSSSIDASALVLALNTASITLKANDSITVSTAVDSSSNANSGNLTLNAPTLNFNEPVTLNGTLSGNGLVVNVGASGLVQNGVDAAAAGATVNLAAATYELTSEVVIDKSLNLVGQTAATTILDGSDGAGPGNGVTRVLEIDGTNAGDTVNLTNLTLENGNGVGAHDNGSGGGLLIYAEDGLSAKVTISNSTISGNSATNYGGGIFNDGEGGKATLTISTSTISGNSADFGGGIYNDGEGGTAKLTISTSTISGNSASSGNGGGVINEGVAGTATLTISNSTISGNSASTNGGGIYNQGDGSGDATLTISTSTISGNSADLNGGGIFNEGVAGTAALTIGDTILADNKADGSNHSDYDSVEGTITDNGYNLYGQNGNNGGFSGNGTTDIQLAGAIGTVLQTDMSGNPLLASNGGPTQTIALVVGSPAYLAGGANTGGELDQRGVARGSTISIGAWDYNPALLSPVVTSNADTSGDVIGSSTVTLRDALTYANAGVFGADPTITFAASTGEFDGASTDNMIALAQGELVIDHSLNLTAASVGGVTIDAHSVGMNATGFSRVMEIDGTNSGDTVSLSNLTLENGNGIGNRTALGSIDDGEGGGLLIYAENGLNATVTISNSTISGNLNAAPGDGGGIFIDGYESKATLTINNSTISNNFAQNNGGGIYNDGVGGTTTLTIGTSTISGNLSTYGGGICNDGFDGTATLRISNSTISGNSATDYGGGIYNYGELGTATLTISTSTIAGNSAVYGGGIYNGGYLGMATLTISNSTISGNLGSEGGGIDNDGYSGVAALTISNSTISGNSATYYGGGIDNNGLVGTATLTISNSTMTGNSAGLDGGGIYNDGYEGTATLTIGDTILAGNTVGGSESDYYSDSGALTDNGYNLFGNDGVLTSNGTTDIELADGIGTVLQTTLVNNVITPELASNGGPTQTIALVVGSPAYLAGGANTGGELDQRGDARGGTISIGAWDYNPALLSPVVTSNGDTVDVIGSSTVTLRDALTYANAGIFGSDPTITFADSAGEFDGLSTDNTITLAQGELVIDHSLTLTAASVGGVAIDAGGNSRVMEIDGSNSGITVNLSNLTLEDGDGGGTNDSGFGGGLFVYTESSRSATVTISNSTISGSSAGYYGGGIYNDDESGNATLTISNSTISGNSAADGGGIYNDGEFGHATLTISNSTLSGNSANSQDGGGIYNDGAFGHATLTISNSTLSGDSAIYGDGGGIYNDGYNGTVTLTIGNSTITGNSAASYGNGGGIANDGFNGTAVLKIADTILAGNTANGSESDYYSHDATFTDNGYNLFGSGGGYTGSATGDINYAGSISSVLQTTLVNSVATPELAGNGGPTQTIALVVGSPAYLAGGPAGSVTTDQRGVARGSTISIGAYDAAPSSVVNSNDDDGLIGVEVNGVVQNSLRDALSAANAGGLGSDPTITFAASAGEFDGVSTDNTITLAQGELVVDHSLNLTAASVGGVTIDAHSVGPNATGNSRVLEIDGTPSGDTVNLSNLTLENGNGYGNGTDLGASDDRIGGGLLVYAESGLSATVTLSNSTISGNSATPRGGGIYNDGYQGNATVTISNSTISGNSATNYGGGVFNYGIDGSAVLTISNSTISGNSAAYAGGGIYNDGLGGGNATLTLSSSTISGNSSASGGGIYNYGEGGTATLTISNSTISGNSAPNAGGGIYNDGVGGTATFTIADTILAGNTLSGSESDYYSSSGSVTDNGYNLFGSGGGYTGSATGDVNYVGSISSILGPLANNGGPTQTMALLDDGGNNPAIGAGGANVGGYELDQRGLARPASNISIGAYESNQIGSPFLVTTNIDPASGDLFGSLRTALNYANANPLLDPTITFNTASVVNETDFSTVQTISLAQGELFITSSLNLDGPSAGVILDAHEADRVMEIDGTTSGDTINLSNLTLENGKGSGMNGYDGGGLFLYAADGLQTTVTLTNSTISGNSATQYGGGIYFDVYGGSVTLTISKSTISDNSAVEGGGIFNVGYGDGNATLTISNSTISGNSASYEGGGIYSGGASGGNGTLTISNSTIAGNSAETAGGGIFNDGEFGNAMLTIGDTILAGNTVGGAESDYFSDNGSFTDNGYNLFGNDGSLSGNGTTDVTVAAIGNSGDISSVLAGTESGSGSTLVFTPTLANNGGPTQTIALVVGSPAYLAGGANTGGELDQRGDARGSTISIGAWDYDPANLSLVVTSNADTVDVIGSTPVTLRDAIFYGEVGGFADPTITFDTSAGQFDGVGTDNTIELAQGELVIDNNLNVDAPSAGVTIDAHSVGMNATGNSRVLEIDGTASGITVALSNLTLENGNGNGTNESGNGGGVLVDARNGLRANVTISDSTISNNSAGAGGGIFNDGDSGTATLTISNSTISGNSATSGIGGYGDGGVGGGIYNVGVYGTATVTISNSTISGNSTDNFAGGIYNDGDDGTAMLTISNSTISGNSATYFAGGIDTVGFYGTATLTIADTILAGNTASGNESDDEVVDGTFTDNGYNLIATGGGINANGTTDVTVASFGHSGDISSVLAGTESNTVFIPTLANNGGPTQTIALVVGSRAYLAGGANTGGELDQRGIARGSTISIGAWDYDPANLSPVVTSNADTTGDVIGSSTVTLRDALFYANAGLFGSDPTITFNTASINGETDFSTAQTITLAQGQLLVDSSLTLDGPSAGVTIDANNASRVMEIDGTSSGDTVNLSNLTLENGNVSLTNGISIGAGLLVSAENGSQATVTISDSTISGNSVDDYGYGGGIYLDGSSGGNAALTIINSTISGNSASQSGGGIYSNGSGYSSGGNATLTISNCTIAGNSAGYDGGGIYNDGDTSGNATLTVRNSTISGNSASYDAGGIYSNGGAGSATLATSDAILAGNTAGGSESDYDSDNGYDTDNGYNLLAAGSGITANGTTDVTVAAFGNSGDIRSVLAGTESNGVFVPTLANNGGPTQTIALILGSPALDAGDPALLGTTDQRGITRGSFEAGTGSAADIGAYEAAIINVTADNREAIYGNTVSPLVSTVLSGPAGDLTGSIAISTPETNAGTYTGDIGQGTLAATGNYLLEFTPGTLTVDARSVIIDPTSGQSKIYGTADPTLTYAVESSTGTTGLVNSDSLTGAISYSGAGQYTGVGTYDFTTGTLANSNYNVVIENSAPTFSITARTVTIDPTAGQSKIYGTADPTLTYTVESSTGTTGLVNGDSLTGAISYSGAGQFTNVGTYDFTTGTLANGNYTVVLENSPPTFAIKPATLTYISNITSILAGQAIPPLTGTVTGFVGGQTLSDATTGTLVFTTPATSSSPSGSYAIDGSGLTANYGNYVFVQAPGNALALTIGGLQFPPLGQPGTPFFNFSAQFDANGDYNTFFTQSWFPLFDPALNGSLIPVFPPTNEPHPVYTTRPPGYAPAHQPSGVIAFGSSFTVGAGERH